MSVEEALKIERERVAKLKAKPIAQTINQGLEKRLDGNLGF
jgi:hypothetical protein